MVKNTDSRLSEINQFMEFVAGRWPQIRPRAASELAKRCQRCILSEHYTSITDGLCDPCRAERSSTGAGPNEGKGPGKDVEAELSRLLKKHGGKGVGNYDALVLFSGGKDSAYLLHRLRHEFNELRLLALTVDNGFMSNVALANCYRIVQRIDNVDHLMLKPQNTLFVKTFRHTLTHLGGGDCYSIVDRMDGDLTFDIGRNMAAALRIPLLIAGISPNQAQRIFGLDYFETRREDERKRRVESAGFRLEEIYSAEERAKYWWDGAAWPEEAVPRVVFPFCAWKYDEEFVRREVVELGLIEPGQDNPLATNNDLIPVMLSVDICRRGYSAFEPEFADMVRVGKAHRELWLNLFQSVEYLSKRGQFMPNSITGTLRRLGLNHNDVHIPTPNDRNIDEFNVDSN